MQVRLIPSRRALGPFGIPDGSAAAPGLYFNSDSDTGLFRVGSGQIGVSSNGGVAAVYDNTGINLVSSGRIGFSSGDPSVSASDTNLYRGAARYMDQQTKAQGAAADQFHRVWGFSGVPASNFERLAVGYDGTTNNEYLIQTQAGGSGTDRPLTLGAASGRHLTISTTGNVSIISGQILAADGLVGTPSYSFANDPDTGFFRDSTQANTVFFTSNGAKAAWFRGVTLQLGSTGVIAWGATTLDAGTASDLALVRDAANVLAQDNGTTAQMLRIYNTNIDGTRNPTNYERLQINAGSGGVTDIGQRNGGTGSSRTLRIGTYGASPLEFVTNSGIVWSMSSVGHFLAGADNTYDIGASAATRPRTIYAGTNILLVATAPGTSGVGVLGIGNGTVPSTSPADMIQIFSVDLSAGNATLGLRTETAVAVDAALISTNSLSIKINGTTYKLMLA